MSPRRRAVRQSIVNQPNFMSGAGVRRRTGSAKCGKMDASQSLPGIKRKDRPGLGDASSGDPTTTGEMRIQEDTSTVVSLRQSPVQCSPVTSTTTQSPGDQAARQAQRDRERILALKLLDLEWTSLSPDVQQAVVALLHAVTTDRPD